MTQIDLVVPLIQMSSRHVFLRINDQHDQAGKA